MRVTELNVEFRCSKRFRTVKIFFENLIHCKKDKRKLKAFVNILIELAIWIFFVKKFFYFLFDFRDDRLNLIVKRIKIIANFVLNLRNKLFLNLMKWNRLRFSYWWRLFFSFNDGLSLIVWKRHLRTLWCLPYPFSILLIDLNWIYCALHLRHFFFIFRIFLCLRRLLINGFILDRRAGSFIFNFFFNWSWHSLWLQFLGQFNCLSSRSLLVGLTAGSHLYLYIVLFFYLKRYYSNYEID